MSEITWEGGEPRWSNEAIAAVGGPDNVLRAAGESDYSGWGCILTKDDRVLHWYYGSCSGCDALEDLDDWESEGNPKATAELAKDIDTFATAEEALAKFTAESDKSW